MLDENKFLAARHGLDGHLVDLPSNERVATKELARRLLDRLRGHAEDLGAADHLDGVEDLLARGTGPTASASSTRPTATFARSWPNRRGDASG